MKKTAVFLLSALFLVCGTGGLAKQAEAKTETTYRDTSVVYGLDAADATATETLNIPYTSKTHDKYFQALLCPEFTYAPQEDGCAAVAGGNLIGFYDRYYESFIPNHTAGAPYLNSYVYNQEDDAVKQVITKLYEYMGIDETGATMGQFMNGIVRYVREKSRTPDFLSCMSKDGFLDYYKVQRYLKENKPVVLFLSSYNVVSLKENDGYDVATVYTSDVPHIMVAFGYKRYIYDNFIPYEYLSVSTGLKNQPSGLFNVNYKTQIDDALAINIT